MIRTEKKKNYSWKDLFLKVKGTSSGEESKIGSRVITTIELNLPVEFTKTCKQWAPHVEFTVFFSELRTKKNYKLWATSYELQFMSYGYEL